MSNEVQITLITSAVSILTLVLTWGLAQLSIYLRAKTAKIQSAALADATNELIANAEDKIRLAVRETSQTYVDALKKAGTFDAAAQKEAFDKSMARFQQLMGDAGMAALMDVESDVEAWVTAQIESSVKSKW